MERPSDDHIRRLRPQPDLYEHFGFTPEKVAERARAVVERASARA
jgi:hypothetical protein